MTILEPLLTVMTSDDYIALSRGTPDETVRQSRQALEALDDDGTVEAIRQRHLPDDGRLHEK